MKYNTNLEKELQEFFNYIGFRLWKLHVEDHVLEPTYHIGLSNKLDYYDVKTPDSFKNNFILPIGNEIKNSPYVKDLTSGLEKKITELTTEVERLKPFETHYNLAFKLQNGKEK